MYGQCIVWKQTESKQRQVDGVTERMSLTDHLLPLLSQNERKNVAEAREFSPIKRGHLCFFLLLFFVLLLYQTLTLVSHTQTEKMGIWEDRGIRQRRENKSPQKNGDYHQFDVRL